MKLPEYIYCFHFPHIPEAPQKRGRGKLRPPCVAIGRKKEALQRVSNRASLE